MTESKKTQRDTPDQQTDTDTGVPPVSDDPTQAYASLRNSFSPQASDFIGAQEAYTAAQAGDDPVATDAALQRRNDAYAAFRESVQPAPPQS
jgi:hypothetical protein